MFSFNDEHELRQLNYERYRKLTKHGHSISSEYSAREALYVVNTDAFGRSYYTKPVGEIRQVDKMTGREYTVEEWSTKEFIIDNKIQLINKTSADLLVGNPPEIVLGDPADELEINDWLKENIFEPQELETLLMENAIAVSSMGEKYFEVVIDDGAIEIREIEPDYIDPVFKNQKLESLRYAWEIEEIEAKEVKFKKLLKKSKKHTKQVRIKDHFRGRIEHSLWNLKNNELAGTISFDGIEPELFEKASNKQNGLYEFKIEDIDGKSYISDTIIEYTGIDELLIIRWPNYKLLSWFGQSDNGMVESLQNAINSRETQINDVLDKHSDPAMYGPSGYLDEHGRLYMSGGGGRYFPIEGDESPPGYLVWDAHITEVHAEIKRFYKAICDNTEVAMALTGMEEGGIESGRALMYRLMRSLAAKARKAIYLKTFLKQLMKVIQKEKIVWIDEGGKNVSKEPRSEWGDLVQKTIVTFKSSLPTDMAEMVANIVNLIAAKTISKKTAIKILSKHIEEMDAKDELANVEKESEDETKKEYAMIGAGLGEAE